MEFAQINAALDGIKADLDKIDLTKEVEKAKAAADKAISQMDKISREENFQEQNLDTAVDYFKAASDRVESYNPDDERAKAISDKANRDKILSAAKEKAEVKDKIKGKYDELVQKQKVIAAYKEKFSIGHLINRQKNRLKANENRIEQNNTRMKEIDDFKKQVQTELETIGNNLVAIKELKELESLNKKLEDLKADLASEKAKPGVDQEFIALFERNVKSEEAELGKKAKKFAENYETLHIDPNNLGATISGAESLINNNIFFAKTEIEKKLSEAEKRYGYTTGFETFINGKIAQAKDDSEYVRVFDDARRELETENINLGIQNEKINEDGRTMARGQKVIDEGATRIYRDEEPTEEEIQKAIQADAEIKALAPELTKKEMRKAVYKDLVGDRKGRFHPILFFKSFGKKTQQAFKEQYEKPMIDKAKEKIKNAKRAQASENGRTAMAVESKRDRYMSELVKLTMQSDKKALEQMDKDAEKTPGAVLTQVYDQVEKDDDAR